MNATVLGFQPLNYYSALQASRAVTATFRYNQNLLSGSRRTHQLNVIESPYPNYPLPPNLPQLCKGDVLDNRYIVIDLLGFGGIGMVVRAHDQVTQKEVAIKITGLDHVDTLEDEMRVTLKLSSSKADTKIPKLLDEVTMGEHKGGVFDYIKGRTLEQEIENRKKIALPDALKIISELASVLMVAENQGIVHRDIKPANVILRDDSGEAVLFDWGLCKKIPKDGVVFGTPTYLPPETLHGKDAGHGTDIYALGIMLWEMLNGRVPFEERGGDLLVILQQLGVKENGLPPIGELPGYEAFYNPTHALVENMTSPFQEFRIQSAAELKQRVDELRAEIEAVQTDIKEFEKDIENLFPEPHLLETSGSVTLPTPFFAVDTIPA